MAAQAELKWEQTTIDVNAATGDKRAIGHFKYHNVGKTPNFFFFLPHTTSDVNAATGDKRAIGHFKYHNVGKTPIRFRSVQSTCGCTIARSQQDQVQSGGKGEI